MKKLKIDKKAASAKNESFELKSARRRKTLSPSRKVMALVEHKERKLKLEDLVAKAKQMEKDFEAMEKEMTKRQKLETSEQKKRVEALTKVVEIINQGRKRCIYEWGKDRESDVWERFIQPERRMPEPTEKAAMYQHLYLWTQTPSSEYFPEALDWCQKYTESIEILGQLLDDPLTSSKAEIEGRQELWTAYVDLYMKKLNMATWNLMRKMELNLMMTNIHVGTYNEERADVKVGLWAYTVRPVVMPRPPPLCTFPQMNATVELPKSLADKDLTVRLIHTSSDFLSRKSPSFHPPEYKFEDDLYQEVMRIWKLKESSRAEQRRRERDKLAVAKRKVKEAYDEARKVKADLITFMETQKLKPAGNDIQDIHIPAETSSEVEFKVATETHARRKKSLFHLFEPPPEEIREKRKSVWEMPSISNTDSSTSLLISKKKRIRLDSVSTTQTGFASQDSGPGSLSQTSKLDFRHETSISFFKSKSMESIHNDPEDSIQDGKRIFVGLLTGESERRSTVDSTGGDSDASIDTLDLVYAQSDYEFQTKYHVTSLKTLVRNAFARSTGLSSKKDRQKRSVSESSKSKKKRRATRRKSELVIPLRDEDSFARHEAEREVDFISAMSSRLSPVYISLREYTILGGVYYLDIIKPPPQPFPLTNHSFIQYHIGPPQISIENVWLEFVPEPLTLDEEENSVEREGPDPGLKKLIRVSVPFPSSSVWLEDPKVVLWNETKKLWTTNGVFDCVQKGSGAAAQITFYASTAAPFAFTQRRFIELPFSAWTLQKDREGGCTLILNCSIHNYTFHIRHDRACLRYLSPQHDLVTPLLGQYMSPPKLVRKLKDLGLDIFPDKDSFTYVTINSAKDPVIEDHAYWCMAMYSRICEFGQGARNREQGFYRIAIRFRESPREGVDTRYWTLHVTKDKTEISGYEQNHFSPDPLTFFEHSLHENPFTSGRATETVWVYYMLSQTRVLSYSSSDHTSLDEMSLFSSASRARKKKRRKTAVSLFSRQSSKGASR